jgi:uncharacterized protein
MNDIVVLFVKYPEPGKVKTRLAKMMGNEKAAEVYKGLVEDIGKILTPFTTWIAFDPPDREQQIRAWLPWARGCFAQEGMDLGQRLHHAVGVSLKKGAKKILLLGSDTMGLGRHIVQGAFSLLDQNDVVLGPARDGGYYLLGLKTEMPRLFEDIPWSTGDVLGVTCRRIAELGCSVGTVPMLQDLDEMKDLEGR